jgi:hypothetical protein
MCIWGELCSRNARRCGLYYSSATLVAYYVVHLCAAAYWAKAYNCANELCYVSVVCGSCVRKSCLPITHKSPGSLLMCGPAGGGDLCGNPRNELADVMIMD